jgi:hypothetical protein
MKMVGKMDGVRFHNQKSHEIRIQSPFDADFPMSKPSLSPGRLKSHVQKKLMDCCPLWKNLEAGWWGMGMDDGDPEN